MDNIELEVLANVYLSAVEDNAQRATQLLMQRDLDPLIFIDFVRRGEDRIRSMAEKYGRTNTINIIARAQQIKQSE